MRTLSVAALLLLATSLSHAATLTVGVGGDYGTIQAAVAAAALDDTVLVAPGEYSAWAGNRIQITTPLTLLSAEGPELTTVRADPSVSDCILVGPLEHPGIVAVGGFTVDGLDISYGVRAYETSSTVIEDCIFLNCLSGVMLGGASSDCEISGCLFTENQNGVNSYASQSSPVTVRDCVFTDNWDIPIEGRGVTNVYDCYIEGGYVGIAFTGGTVERNLIVSCTTGIGVSGTSHVVSNTVVDCGVGVRGINVSTPTSFHHNIVALNVDGMRDTFFSGSYGCNNVWGNTNDDYVGAHPAEDDFPDCDPLFCDAAQHDYELYAASPCGPEGPCGLIGACGVGCSTSATQAVSWSRLKALYR